MTGIEKTLQVMFTDDQVIELRVLGKKKNDKGSGGYYKDRAKLIEKANIMDSTNNHFGIYVVMNKINEACFARSPDSYLTSRDDPILTSKNDIEHRNWLLVDLDPTRPTGIASTDDEKEHALNMARGMIEYLSNLGWPTPVLADSGNGYHNLYKIDLANTPEAETLVKNVLNALNQLFSTNLVKVDTQNFEANRIIKLYGTLVRKGANTEDRPWRRSGIVETPETIETVPIELLQEIANLYEPEIKEHNGDYEKTDLGEWLESHGLSVYKTKRATLGTIWVLERCPWDSSHTDKAAYVLQTNSGAVKAECKHESCKGKGFKDLWYRFEETRLNKNRTKLEQRATEKRRERIKRQNEELEPIQNQTITADELGKCSMEYNPSLKLNLPDDHFLMKFLYYGRECSDAYDELWIAGGLSILSTLCHRNVEIRMKHGKITPNTWCQCIGVSSATRKSTVINKVDLILTTIGVVNRLPDDMSPEAMIEILSEDSRSFLLADESASVMEALKKDYQRGMKDILMKMYDGKSFERKLRTKTNKKTTFLVIEPYLSILMATTPTRFAASSAEEDLNSGWFQRFIYFYPNAPKTNWKPMLEETDDDVRLEMSCVGSAKNIKTAIYDAEEKYYMHISRKATKFFNGWQHKKEVEVARKNDDVMSALFSRLSVYAIKLAMLFEIGNIKPDGRLPKEISLTFMKEACRIIDEYFIPIAVRVEKTVGKSWDKNVMDRIIAYLTTQGGKATRRDVMRKLHVRVKEVDENIDALVESEEIMIKDIIAGNNRRVTWLILKDLSVISDVTQVSDIEKRVEEAQKKELPKEPECDIEKVPIYTKTNNNIRIRNDDEDRSVTVSQVSCDIKSDVEYIGDSCDTVTLHRPMLVEKHSVTKKTDNKISKKNFPGKICDTCDTSISKETEDYKKNRELLKQGARYCNSCKDPLTGMIYELPGLGEICGDCYTKKTASDENRKKTPVKKVCKFCGNQYPALHLYGSEMMCHSCSMANRDKEKQVAETENNTKETKLDQFTV